MTTVRITLSDELARELAEDGLLESRVIEVILRDWLRAAHISNLAKLRADPIEPMTNDEINAETQVCRAEQRRASGY